MAAAGFFTEYDQFELLGGEIVPMMSPAGRRREIVRQEIAYRMARLAPDDIMVASEPQFNLGPDTFVKPDILVHPRAIKAYDSKGADALLVVEVAETSLSHDLKTKLSLYASNGVREYWAINAVTLMTNVHRQPAGTAYRVREEVPPRDRLVPSSHPNLPYRSLNSISVEPCRGRDPSLGKPGELRWTTKLGGHQ